MDDELPNFRYFPDPVDAGSVVRSAEACASCGRSRGWVYARRPYAKEATQGQVCPWCIADGSAAAKLSAQFVSDLEGRVPPNVMDEVLHRTPGYESWQGEWWLVHCGDACEFLGEMTTERFAAFPPETLRAEAKGNGLLDWYLEPGVKYERGSSISVYEFRCRHCGVQRLWADAC